MVYKVSKGGVRSGNTLRCLRSVRIQRYSSQACILTRSNLRAREVPGFLESATEDQLVTSTLTSTDVLLSLNKKARWTLPATVSHMIKAGHFGKGKTMVSLLERHKLKKRANCVSFVCNQSRVRNVTPKQKGYFSYNLENINSEQTIKEWKKQKAEAMKKVKPPVVTISKARNGKPIKTVEVFTVNVSMQHGLSSTVPEYRIEVFRPCPQSCSLVYNPKYTNVQADPGDDGIKEGKFNTKLSKHKKRNRKRFTAHDLKLYQDEVDVEDFWSDNYDDSDVDPVSDTNSIASCQKNDGCFYTNTPRTEETIQEYHIEEPLQFSENFLSSLISQTEKARSMYGSETLPRRQKNIRRCHKDSSSDSEDKSHVIYVDDVHPRFSMDAEEPMQFSEHFLATLISQAKEAIAMCGSETFPQSQNNANRCQKGSSSDSEDTSHTKQRKSKTAKQASETLKPTYVNIHYGRVIMKSSDTTPEVLRAKYGYSYAEADSEPRRFIINVTDDVYNILCTHRFTEQNAMYTSYLVFVHDGVYDKGLDTFKVNLNSNICTHTKPVEKSIPFQETSIETIMNQVVSILLDMKEDNFLSTNHLLSQESTMKPVLKFVNDLMRVSVETCRTFDEINRLSQTDALQEHVNLSTSFSKMIRDLDFDVFCDICYENVNSSQPGSVSGTRLSKCGHVFCDDCWRSHFRAKIDNGAQKMACPGYDCEEDVGPVTLLSLLHVSEVTKLFQRKREGEIESAPNSRWCPNPGCGRIIKLGRQESVIDVSFDVTCTCGQEFCCLCLSQPHWPATCGQAQEYRQKLTVFNPAQESQDDSNDSVAHHLSTTQNSEVMEVEGRLCPKCSKFIDKDGGCLHMSCKCGYQFCWDCLGDWYNHNICSPNASVVFEHTRKVKVNHISIPGVFLSDTKVTNQPKPVKPRQKATMYQKALQQRSEAKDCKYHARIRKMVKKLAHLAQKDLLLKKEILSLCGTEVKVTDESNLVQATFTPHVTKFLRSCVEVKRALHHVAEFTFVLAQDLPDSMDRRRILRLADVLHGYCSFIKSIFDLGHNQDVRVAIRRLVNIQAWSKRTLTVLLGCVRMINY